MQTIIQFFLTTFTKKALKTFVNFIVSEDLFKEIIRDLILGRVKGLEAKYPETYESFVGFTTALAEMPAILTDDDPNNVEQIALLLRIQQLDKAAVEARSALGKYLDNSRAVKISLT